MNVERVNLNPMLVHELQLLERVALAEEREKPTGQSMPRLIAIRQADYLTRHVLNGRLADWWSAVSSEVRPCLVSLKKEVDHRHGTDELCEFFADRMIDTVARAELINAGIRAA